MSKKTKETEAELQEKLGVCHAKKERVKVASAGESFDREKRAAELMLAAKTADRTRGLLLTQPHGKNLLLMSCNDVHTAGMRHAIDVAFVDRTGCVIEAHCAVGPMRRLRNRRAVAVVERFSSCEIPWFAVGEQLTIASEQGGEQ